MKTAIVNLGAILTGDWREPVAAGDTIVMSDGRIVQVGTAAASQIAPVRRRHRCGRDHRDPGPDRFPCAHHLRRLHAASAHRGLPRKLRSRRNDDVHLGVRSPCAGTAEGPGWREGAGGRRDEMVRALPPRRHAGLRRIGDPRAGPRRSATSKNWRVKGVWLAKAGFGAFETPFEYAPMVQWAKQHGMITTVHTGGSSIPGSTGIWADHLIAMQPHVSFHVNGGPIAMPDRDFPRLVNETKIALQLCTAGNLRTALWTAELLEEAGQFERLLIATDTPTGSGIMPLGMLYTISHLASLDEDSRRMGHRRRDRQQRRCLPPEQRLSPARPRRRRGAHRCLRRRLAGQRARRSAQRRHRRGGRRGDGRRCPALSDAAATRRARSGMYGWRIASCRGIFPAARTDLRAPGLGSGCNKSALGSGCNKESRRWRRPSVS